MLDALRAHFTPEFLNRVDDIIIFRPLGKEQLVKIVDLRLEDLRRLLADRKISIELTDAAKELLFTEGYDPHFGARPLKRAIQKLVQDPLAMKILDGEVLHGDHIIVDVRQEDKQIDIRGQQTYGRNREVEESIVRQVRVNRIRPRIFTDCTDWKINNPRKSVESVARFFEHVHHRPLPQIPRDNHTHDHTQPAPNQSGHAQRNHRLPKRSAPA